MNVKIISKLFHVYFVLIVIVILSSFNFGQSIDSTLSNYLKRYNQITHYPSISAGVSLNGKIIWLGSTGYSDLENNVKASPNSVYRVASISKLFTAVAVMQLVEEGKVKLDEDARTYIPYFPKKRWKFTVRQILDHTSGVRSYKSGEFNNTQHYNSIKEALGLILNDPLVYKPGTKYLYTTFGYNVLAAIIENVSGESFIKYVHDHIFVPAQMNNTFPENQPDLVMHRARGYIKDSLRNFKNAPLADLSEKYAGGGFISNAKDLLKFGNALLEGKLIKPSTLDTMLVSVKVKGVVKNVGLGFEVNKMYNGINYFGHFGYGTGFSALLIINREKHIAAVDLINLQDGVIQQPAFELSAITLNQNYKLPKYQLADTLLKITVSSNLESAIKFYEMNVKDSLSEYNMGKSQFIKFGKYLINNSRLNDAVKFYKYALNLYPTSWQINQSLGLVYYHLNDNTSSLIYLKKSSNEHKPNKYVENLINKLSAE